MAVAGWLGADYLSANYVADGYLRKQEYLVSVGAWSSQGYVSLKWINDRWLHSHEAAEAAAVQVLNVLALPLVVLDGAARQTTKVNATTVTLPLATFAAVANAGHHITQANVPNLALATFAATTNGSVYQIGDLTFTIEVNSAFGYTDLVAVQNVPGLALDAIDAIVTLGADVNVAATRVSLPLVALPTTAKANSSTLAISSIALPLQVYDCTVLEGRAVEVLETLALPLVAIPVAVTAAEFNPNHIFATVAELPLGTFPVEVGYRVPEIASIRLTMLSNEIVIEIEAPMMRLEAA